MKKILFTLLVFSSFHTFIYLQKCCAQNPLVKKWDKRFGGDDADNILSIQQTADGGFMLGGQSWSGNVGDKTQACWGLTDYWIVKTDSLGNRQWDKDFGGVDFDWFYSIQQTSDHGYILGGFSSSGISGDKTQATRGLGDYWIVKVDSMGIKQWDKDFGGTDDDILYSVQQTSDGGYILGGNSLSGMGGDKSQGSRGLNDFWIVKTDSMGIKQWDVDFGGTDIDGIYSIQQTRDGGFIFGGFSNSGIGGDKTQNTWGVLDYWIVKTDSLGNKQWDKDFGGTEYDYLHSIQQTSDDGYILGGWTYSGIGGDKTAPLLGTTDFWIVKIDSSGIKQWDRGYGGTDWEDDFGNISQVAGGGYLIAGTSYSSISGNKTENNLGTEQTWVLKTDSFGNVIWDKTVLSMGHDEKGLIIETRDGCYVIASMTSAGIGGEKTQTSRGANDYWILKYCETLHAAFASPTSVCPGSCIDFISLSLNATNYQWFFPGATPATSTDVNPTNICYANPGSYDVQLIAFNTNGSDTLTLNNYITVYPSPPPQSITQNGDTLFAIAGSASYQWYFNGNIINGATDYFYVAQSSGDYNVVATDANGCEVEAAIFNVIAGLTPALSKGEGVMVFPNPVVDKCTIHNALPIAIGITMGTAIKISIYNLVGEKILAGNREQFGRSDILQLDCTLLPSGMYYVYIDNGENVLRGKFVKQ